MIRDADTETLIIGAGFAGLSVAEKLLGRDYTIVDRGTPLDPAAARKALVMPGWDYQFGELGPLIEAEARAIGSGDASGLQLPLSIMSVNVYTYQQGGISNWWGGYTKRITEACFGQDGVLAWPIGLVELDPYYRHAEHALRVHGDPSRTHGYVYGALPGWETWREYLAPLFAGAHVTSEAKNITDLSGENKMGICTGNGHCAICSNDAKARPSTVFPHHTVFGRVMVKYIMFDGARAVAARCVSDGEEFDITFDRVVVAAGGLENNALLRRSRLPKAVRRDLIGRWYQDHTAAEIYVRMPNPIPYYQIGAEAHVELPDISGVYRGLEVKALFLTIRPDLVAVNQTIGRGTFADAANLRSARDRLGRIYLQIEIPPEWDLRIRTRGEAAFLYTMPYFEKIPVIDMIVHDVIAKLSDRGLRIECVCPHYRQAFGGHHYSGTIPMSRNSNAMIDENHLLHGTENVYISGACAIPRCGGAGPTLSIIAMGLRLGDILLSFGR
jgi:choline dehydrogenase-like flavoprotein